MFWLSNQHNNKSLAERVRLALQDLGPIWIKLGQMLSTRKDIFSSEITEQLSLLQDQVNSVDGKIARCCIEKSLGVSIETCFDNFNEIPLASASIAQVHSAILKHNNQQIVIKIIRPNIIPTIKNDIQIMYFIAKITKLFFNSYKIKPLEIVKEYEKTLIKELNLLHEAANTMQLRNNFKNSNLLYIPKVYMKYCRENILVMERIYGIPVSNISELKRNKINLKLLAERGVIIFFTQVFRDSFFHADMHPGNIFINKDNPENPQYIGIDCGIMGTLNNKDQRYLASNFIAFFNRDYRRVAELHIDSGWVPFNTNITDFEYAIKTICEPIFAKSISEISFAHILYSLFKITRSFNMEIQPQLLLLQKTLLYIEGLGKQLYPQLDLWKTAKPFLENWMSKQIGFTALLRHFKRTIPMLIERLPEIPEIIFDITKQHKFLKDNIHQLTLELQKQQTKQHQLYYLIYFGAISMLCNVLLYIFNIKIFVICCFICFEIFFILAGFYLIRKIR